MTSLLLAAVVLLVLALAWQFMRQRAAIDAGNIVWRVAMDYIAEEHCDLPHEFAACFVAGNQRALAEKFPGFAPYLSQRLAEWEAE